MELLLSSLISLVLGAVMGLFGGMFGIGGGIIAIPVLVLGFGMEQTTAQGTALAMMVPNLVLAWWRYAQRNPVGLGAAAAGVAVVATLTTWIAAQWAQGLNPSLLRLLFAAFLVGLGIWQWLPRAASASARPVMQARLVPLVGVVGGSSMGLLGIGGGLVSTPILTGLFGFGQRAAQSIALALVTPSSAAALFSYAEHHRVDWPVGVALALGGAATVSAGVAIAHAFSERTLQKWFSIMLIATGLLLVVRG